MKTFIKIIAVVSLLTVAMMAGCSDRGTNAPYTAPGGKWMYNDAAKHAFSPYLRFQLKNPYELLNMTIYMPEPAWYNQIRVPLLVLLAPQGGDQYYYFDHGLFQLAEQMIRDSVIHPMAILCIGNDQVFGGYYYGNSLPAGLYDSIVGGDLISSYMHDQYAMVYDDPGMRGIGGVGQGAYGAFRAALVHPGTFKSITVTDGPLDFDGADGTGGLVPQFRAALLEQGLLGNDSAFAEFDSSATHPISRMLIGAALAFSPHDDSIRYRVDTVDTIVPGPDTLAKALRISIQNRYQLSDSTTLVTRVVNGYSQYGDLTGFDFHFPFDNSGQPYQGPDMIWQRWMRNNLDSLYWHSPSAQPLAGVQMYFLETPEADNGYHEQTVSFRNFLANRHLNSQVWVKQYEGYKGKPATKDQYLYDLMKDMLIFHSHAFYNEPQ